MDNKTPIEIGDWKGWKIGYVRKDGKMIKYLAAHAHGTGLIIRLDNAYANRTPPNR